MYSKVLIAAAVCVVCVLAAPATDVVPLEKQQPTVIPIVSQSEELEANGTFKFSYETANGIKREEEAYRKVVPKAKGSSSSSSSSEGSDSNEDSHEIFVQRGSYSYTAPDGTLITVTYIADENGFQPIGNHIPRAPSAIILESSPKKSEKPADTAASASEPKKEVEPVLSPAIAPAIAPAKPEEPPKEVTTGKPDEVPENPEPKESSTESVSNSTPIQPTTAETTESVALTDAFDDKQTTANAITEASQTTEAANPSTTTSVSSSGEEMSTTTAFVA